MGSRRQLRILRLAGIAAFLIGWVAAITGSAEAQPGQFAKTITRQLYITSLYSSETQELAVVDPAATSGWIARSTTGADFRLPAGWQEMPWDQGRLAGVATVRYSGPACPASAPCDRTGDVLVMVERTDNQASASNHTLAATLQAQGYYRLAATIGGQPAAVLLPPDGVSSGFAITERAGVRYTIAFAPTLWEDQAQFLKLIVGTMNFRPAEAPEPFVAPAAKAAPARAAAPAARAPLEVANLNITRMVSYALDYGTRRTNKNNCYIYAYTVIVNGEEAETLRCSPTLGSGYALKDAAQFVDCALEAGGLPEARCEERDSLANYTWSYYRVWELYQLLLTLPHQIIPGNQQPKRGDIIIVGDGTIDPSAAGFSVYRACWMGVVVPYSPTNQLLVAAHSTNEALDLIDITPASMYCGSSNQNTAKRLYLRLITDETPPTVAFSEPAPGRFAYGAAPTLRWLGADEPDGSGIQGYTLRRKVNAGAWQDVLTLQAVTEQAASLNQPCNTVLYEVTAIDNAGNVSLPATLTMTVGLQGDFDLNGMVDAADTELVDAAWGTGGRSASFDARLDLTGDGNINAADLTWMHLHQGDRCAN